MYTMPPILMRLTIKTRLAILSLFSLISLFAGLTALQGAEKKAQTREERFAPEVAKLAAEPAPSPGGILMVGSSIFKRWTTAAVDFAPLPITNRAFGGSRTVDQLLFFDQIVPSSKAALVVWYCGSNDVNGKVPPDEIVKNTSEWLTRTRAALPDAVVVLLSVIRAPQKRDSGYLSQVDETNRGLKKLAESVPDVTYLDVNPALETPGGEAQLDCYIEDKLHLNAKGYAQMTSILRRVLDKEWKSPALTSAATKS